MADRRDLLIRELETLREELTIQNDELRSSRKEIESSRDRYVELYELAPAGYLELDEKGNVLSINRTGQSLLGISREAIEGYPLMAFVSPPDIQKYIDHLMCCRNEGGPVDTWISLSAGRGPGKKVIRAHLASVEARRDSGTVIKIAFLLSAKGLQEEEEEEEERKVMAAALSDFSRVALSREKLADIAAAATRIAARTLGLGFVEVLELLPDGKRLRTVAVAGRKGKAVKRVSAEDSPYNEVLRDREPVIVDNQPADIVSRASHLAQSRVSSGVAVYVPAEPGRPYGILGAYSIVQRAFTPVKIDFLQSLAMTLGAAAATRLLESNLRESEERFRSLVANIPVGIFIVRDGRIVYRNTEQERLFGSMPGEYDLAKFRDVHPEDMGKFRNLCAVVTGKDGVPQEMDLRFYPFGKSTEGVDLRWAQVHTISMEFGGKKSWLVSMVDISRLKEMEYQFLVREKMASLGHVATGIAHEIRNPLSGINIHLAALQQVWDGGGGLEAGHRDAAMEIVRQIQTASNRIESVIKKVMDFSRSSAVRVESADILLAIENAIDFTSTQLRRERITLDRTRLGPLPKCTADPALITQVVMNLIVNAAQAMWNSKEGKVIELSSFVEGSRIVICVSDSGPGIPQAMRDRIFDPFYTTRKEGYGIGLSFCRRVIGEHGGLVKVDTGRLGGAEFRIEIPIQHPRETA